MLYTSLSCGWEPVLIHWILIVYEAILEIRFYGCFSLFDRFSCIGHKAEIDTREDIFGDVFSLGKELLSRSHYASNEIKEKLMELTDKRNGMIHRSVFLSGREGTLGC